MKQDQFDFVCGVCGFWVLVQEHVLPVYGIGEKRISELDTEFRGSQSNLMSACGDIMLKEPPLSNRGKA